MSPLIRKPALHLLSPKVSKSAVFSAAPAAAAEADPAPGFRSPKEVFDDAAAAACRQVPRRHLNHANHPKPPCRTAPWSIHRFRKFEVMQAALVASLQKVGREDQALKVRQCHARFARCRCKSCGSEWGQPLYSCSVRLCPWEARKRSARAIRRYERVIRTMKNPQYFVLSRRNCSHDELASNVDALFESFERLRHSVFWTRSVDGAFVSLEATFDEDSITWHPHLNVLIDGSPIDQEDLARAWRKAARDQGLIVPHIERVKADSCERVMRYMTKPQDFLYVPEAVDVFLHATGRARLMRSYGCFFGLKLAPEADRRRARPQCPDCASCEIETAQESLPQRDLYFDGSGVFRFHREPCRSSISVSDG